jgi:hypothetical protein
MEDVAQWLAKEFRIQSSIETKETVKSLKRSKVTVKCDELNAQQAVSAKILNWVKILNGSNC